MRKLYVLCICLLLISNIAQAERKKVGLVLSGGGAKGVAHIGVIKVLEEAGIPIDYIAGTSMGALVGALYAIGYDAHTLDSLVREQDWSFLLSDKVYRYDLPFSEKNKEETYLLSIPMFGKKIIQVPAGFISGQNIYNLFSELTIGYHDSISFLDLYIPFSAVAANLVNGEEVILDRGNLPLAMRASMAIPGVFAPVSLDSMTLVDGGIANNFPTDVGKSMGADIIIGVDVSSPLQDKDELNTVLDIVNQLTSFLGMQKYEDNLKLTDLYIKPNIQPYSAASFDAAAIDTLLQRGEDVARSQWDEIIKLKEKIGLEPDERIVKEKPEMFDDDHIYIEKIVIEGMEGNEESWIRNRVKIKENSVVSLEQIYQAVSRLYGTGMYSNVNYRLGGEDRYELTFSMTEKPQGSLNFGFRFDSEEMAAILLNTTLANKKWGRSHLSITGRLSINPYVKVEYALGNTFIRQGVLEYMYKYNDINLYRRGDKANNMTFSYHKGELRFSDLNLSNFIFQLGLRYEYFNFNFFSMSEFLSRADAKSEGILSYFGSAQYETFDRKYYPTKGMSFSAQYALHTSNGFQYDGSAPFSSISFNYTLPISFNKYLAFIPAVYGRVLIGNNIPLPYRNYMGGVVPGRYFNQQLAFVGINHMELFDNSILAASLNLRVKLAAKHYISGVVNYAMHDDNFFEIFSGSNIWGGGIKYSYDFLLGPVDVWLNLSDWDKKLGFYFNLGYYF